VSGRGRSEERLHRIVLNEAAFRAVNEQIAPLNEAFAGLGVEDVAVICECGDLACLNQFTVSTAEYRRVRADPLLFLVEPGHELPEAEDVVARHDRYLVVRKRAGESEQIARASDPRRSGTDDA
jgi:hypothetical protein